MDWRTRVVLIADLDHALHQRAWKQRKLWTAKRSAHLLRIPPSTLTMAVQLRQGLAEWPELAQEPTLRQAYDTYRQKRKTRSST